jgi:hypothetical protein
MGKYPTREIRHGGEKDPNTGGSITFLEHQPDFSKFTKEHWEAYHMEELQKKSNKQSMIITILVLALFSVLAYFGV